MTSVAVGDGIGGQRSTDYTYAGARIDFNGRGFLGFSSVVADRSTDRQLPRDDLSPGLPLHRSLRREPHSTPRRGTLFEQNDVLFAASETHLGVFHACTDLKVHMRRELDGSYVSTKSTDFTYDEFGNATRTIEILSGVDAEGLPQEFRADHIQTTTNHESSWILGLVTRSELSKSGSDTNTMTRLTTFDHDAATGLLLQETVEPDIPLMRRITDLEYDGFGNATRTTLSGPTFESRSTHAVFDAKGRFATTTTNAVGHTTAWTYDNTLGVPLSRTDPNGLMAIWSYDGFGRKVGETRPDGTATSYAREWSVALPNNPPGGVIALSTQVTGSVGKRRLWRHSRPIAQSGKPRTRWPSDLRGCRIRQSRAHDERISSVRSRRSGLLVHLHIRCPGSDHERDRSG